MTLNVMVAQAVTDAALLSHNLPDPNPEWDSATSFSRGDVVKVAAAKRLYESAADSNQDNDPSIAANRPALWFDRGPMLPWRLFDGGPLSAAQSDTEIDFTLAAAGLGRGFALIGAAASQVRYTILGAGDVVVADVTIPLVSTDHIVDATTLFLMPLETQDVGIVDSLLYGDGNKLRIRIGQPGEPVVVGEFLHGDVHRIGRVVTALRGELVDYSTEADGIEGPADIVERDYTFDRDYPVKVFPNRTAGAAERRLAGLRAKRALYWAGQSPQFAIDAGLVTYGRLTHLIKTSTADDITDFSITVEGRL